MKRHVFALTLSGVSATVGVAVYNRPLFDDQVLDTTNAFSANLHITILHSSFCGSDVDQDDDNGPRRNKTFLLECNPFDHAGNDHWTMSAVRFVAVVPGLCVFRTVMQFCGDFKIHEDKEYDNFLKKVAKRGDAALITVANHRARYFDDPGVMSCILPLWMQVQPRYMRWGLCAQVIFFKSSLNPE